MKNSDRLALKEISRNTSRECPVKVGEMIRRLDGGDKSPAIVTEVEWDEYYNEWTICADYCDGRAPFALGMQYAEWAG